MATLDSLFELYLPPLEAEMRAVVQVAAQWSGLFGMLQYHLGWVDESFKPCQVWAGKRVRPVLCLLSCQACGGEWERALPAGAAIELMHNFTLIHDDIEDGDRMRRGRPTLWAIWGVPQGVNAGDALFALTQLALTRLAGRGTPAASVVEAFYILNQTCVQITGGQYLDVGFESRADISVAEYLEMIEGKTAALTACACELGALVAGAPAAQREQLRSFGLHLGMAFQIRDDVLGIWGDPAVTGKRAGADIVRRKKSLPIVYGLARSAALRALLAQEVLSEDDVQRATALLQEEGSREYAGRLAAEHHEQAMTALESAHLDGAAAEALRALAEMLRDRER